MKMYSLMKIYTYWHVLKEICHKIKYLTHIKFISSTNLKVKKIKCVGNHLGMTALYASTRPDFFFYKLSSLMHHLNTIND